jgi:hypothetical protein
LKVCVLLLSLCAVPLFAFPATEPGSVANETAIVQKYTSARNLQEIRLKAASMDIDIQGEIPKLKKQGRFHALRRISPKGLISYDLRHFEGDGTVKNQLIIRYLSAEAQSRKEQTPSLAVTPDNYRFKYKGRRTLEGREAHLFQISPIKKREGMFQGELWLDVDTCLPLRESGSLVKKVSIFVRKTAFVRTFEIHDGLSLPRQEQWEFQAVGVGKAELIVAFSNFSLGEGASGELDNE